MSAISDNSVRYLDLSLSDSSLMEHMKSPFKRINSIRSKIHIRINAQSQIYYFELAIIPLKVTLVVTI